MKQGKAYGFFDCKASKREIEAQLPRARKMFGKTPFKLELSLREVKGSPRNQDPDLLKFIRENEIYPTFPSKFEHLMGTAKPIKMIDLRYMMEARYPNETNKDAAHMLGNVMDGVNHIFGNEEPFNVAVVAKIDGEYWFKE